MTSRAEDRYRAIVNPLLDGFGEWKFRAVIDAEVARAAKIGPYRDPFEGRLANRFEILELCDYLAPMNELMADSLSSITNGLTRKNLAEYQRRYQQNCEEVFVGVSPMASLQAKVGPVADRVFLIFVNIGLIHTVYTLAKACVSQLPLDRRLPFSKREPAVRGEIVRDHLKKYFFHLLKTNGTAPSADHLDVPLNDDSRHCLAVMFRAAEKFVIAHEFAHIVCGHLDSSRLTMASLTNDQLTEVYATTVEQEAEADKVGLEIAFADFPPDEAEDDVNVRSAIAGVNLVFHSLMVLEKLFNRESDTHPPSDVRHFDFKSFYWKQYPSRFWTISNQVDYLLKEEWLTQELLGQIAGGEWGRVQ